MKRKIQYTLYRSPLGWILLASTDTGICQLSIGSSKSRLVDELRSEFGPQIVRDDTSLARHVNGLKKYFRGEKVIFKGPFHLLGTGFQRRIWKALLTIPYGEVRTYGQIACKAESPRGFRATGQAVGKNPLAIMIPCHRVIASGGRIGGFGLGLAMKRQLLEIEGFPARSLK